MEIMSESDSDRLSVNRFFRAETYDNVQNIIDYISDRPEHPLLLTVWFKDELQDPIYR